MNKKIQLVVFALLIILLVSIVLNVYLVRKNAELSTNINAFIPAAVSLEAENKRLQEKEKKQQLIIDELSYLKDSTFTIKNNTPATKPILSNNEPVESSVPVTDPGTERTFRDMNKEQ